jgi:hypothetical protein
MAQLPTIDFTSWKDPSGYRLAKARPDDPLRVVRNGRLNDGLVVCRPLGETHELFRIFARTATTEEGVLAFVQSYGPLTHYGNNPGDIVEYVLFHARAMRDLLDSIFSKCRPPPRLPGKSDTAPGSTLYAAVVWDDVKKSLRWELRPSTLLDGLWLQFGQAVTRGAHIRTCAHCGEWFETGAGTGRRLDAKFCSDQHRTAYNSLKRSREK